MTNIVETTTNNIPQIPDVLEPIVRSLPPWAGQILAWVMTTGFVLAPASVWISHKLRDFMNKAAETQAIDDDSWLRKLFSNPIYRTVAVLLRFVSIDLPTLAELERAIALQNEAVTESKPAA